MPVGAHIRLHRSPAQRESRYPGNQTIRRPSGSIPHAAQARQGSIFTDGLSSILVVSRTPDPQIRNKHAEARQKELLAIGERQTWLISLLNWGRPSPSVDLLRRLLLRETMPTSKSAAASAPRQRSHTGGGAGPALLLSPDMAPHQPAPCSARRAGPCAVAGFSWVSGGRRPSGRVFR
jgi:hypothetical protein